MKRMIWILMAVLCLIIPACASAEIGFAEVKMENVNVRNAPGGESFMQLDKPQSVFVFEEKQKGEHLWCHVTTLRRKGTVEGWIRADMLRMLSDEFADMRTVQAGDHYVTGVRRDGSVAILGDDMPHSPCVESVRTWRNIAKTTSSTCAVYALDQNGKLITVGRSSEYGIWQAADLSGEQPVLLDEVGRILKESWQESAYADEYIPPAARGVRFQEVAPIERIVQAGLTKAGEVLWFEENEPLNAVFANGPYTDIDMHFYHLAALRADGCVDAAIRVNVYQQEASQSACDVSRWKDIVQVATGVLHTIGLKADGTVCYAGDDARHRAQVEAWSDVIQIDAGNGYSIALRSDGSVLMAGKYEGYLR